MEKCTRCLNDSTVRRMNYDENGVCKYCQNYDKISSKLSDSILLNQLFTERIERVRGRYDYDVALGISGGKDSIFVLYQLINKYKLKVKTFTMINGFFSDNARKNVDRLVKEFNVEHEYIYFDSDMLKRFYRYSMKHWLTPCIACSYLGYTAMINYTVKINAGMCIHGRSPQQMLRYYGDDVFTSFVDAGLKSVKNIDINKLYQELLSSVENKMDKNLMKDVKEMLYKNIKSDNFREFVGYFLYHDYDEKQIVDFLRTNTGWITDDDYNHYDCRVHNASHYIYQCAEGRPHCLPEVSVLVRSGKISYEEGIRLVEAERYSQKPTDELKLLCDTVGLNLSPILLKANIYNRFIKK